MDIVDAFTFPEHLEDALFLGPNLENEGCDELITSDNVLEDSLKNMLSDKDPMLGSASTQFCLPILDNDSNFQLTCATVIGLDEIMDEDCVKEGCHDTIDEDLLLPSGKLKLSLDASAVTSPLKSPRLLEKEPVQSLRQSTVAKRSSTSPSTSPKKAVLESTTSEGVGKKDDLCLTPVDVIESKDDGFMMKTEQHKPLQRSIRHTSQTEHAANIPLSFVTDSRMNSNEVENEAKAEHKYDVALQERSEVKSDVFNNHSVALDSQAYNVKSEIKIESTIETEFEQEQSENTDYIKVVKHEKLVDLAAQKSSLEENVDESMDERIKSLKKSSSGKQAETHDGAFQNLNERPDELSLLSSSVCKDISGSPWSKTSVDSVKDCKIDALDVKTEGIVSLQVNCLESGITNTVDVNKECIPRKVVTGVLENTTAQCMLSEKGLSGKGGGRGKRSRKSNIHSTSSSLSIKTSNGMKKSRVRSAKTVVIPLQNQAACVQEQHMPTSKCMFDAKTQKVTVQVDQPIKNRGKRHLKSDAPASLPSLNLGKGKKVNTTKDLKIHSSTEGNKVAAKIPSVFKKKQRPQAEKTLTHILDGELKNRHIGQNEGSQPFSLHAHTHFETEQSVHSISSTALKQLEAPLKTNAQTKEEAEQKENMAMEHLKEEEKLKLKKGLPPRQRRSSKSISLDEPPLFIPDNIAPGKKDGAEPSLQTDCKIVSLHGKQCAFCKKNHIHRFMVGCGRCDDWFHGDCVGLSLIQAQQLSENGKEYICLKCSASNEKNTEHFDHSNFDNREKANIQVEKSVEEKCVMSKGTLNSVQSGEKSGHTEYHVKPKVKTLNKSYGDSISSSEGKESESKKSHTTPVRNVTQTAIAPRLSSEEKNKVPKRTHPSVSHSEEKTPKSGTVDKQEVKKKSEKRVQSSNAHLTTPPVPKQSVDQIRQSVRQTLNDILLKRLSESHSKIPEERAGKVAAKIEKELFSFYRDIDAKYKSKYRSLTFNLRDPKNNILFKRVLKGDVSADHLIKMSPEELASKELAAWRQRETRHTIEMIEKEERNIERRPITKITHKGEIEIETDSSLKVAETMETEESTAQSKPVEKAEETPKEKDAEMKSTLDTTTQHKNHLFDLNCKICTGRMAPPTEPLSPKKVQVAIGVARKNSDTEGESIEDDIASALSTASTILATELLEAEKPESPKVTVSSPVRPKKLVPVEDEATFLARLSYIWKGFVNMPSVARFVIKAYPVSGALDCLTEDLPDSIQVGGRISPQTVWDYVEKIKASGTKETCLIRFCPATEEDQISYTSLFAYFSSRRRYGVVANNMRQVKDMYLIPLGATEKIPRFLVPFDEPGLESRRPNLLLALIIRQRLKRSLSTSLDDDSLGLSLDVTPEKRTKNEISHKDVDLEGDEDENDFFNSFTAVLHKGRNRPEDLEGDEDDDDDDDDDEKDEPEATVEPASVTGKSELLKPLRFLPGVLVGWENQSSALDLASKPLPVDDILQSLLGDGENVFESEMALDETSKLIDEKMTDELSNNCVSETKVRCVSEIKAGIKKSQDCPAVKKAMNSPVVKNLYATRTLKTISLKGKPPDVSTEAFLANLSATQSHDEDVRGSKERKAQRTLHESKRTLHEPESNTDSCFSASDDKLTPLDDTGNSPRTRKLFVKRDPRQAAVRTSPFTSSYSKARDSNKIQERQTSIEQQHMDISGNASKYNEKKNSSNVKDSLFSDRLSVSQSEGSRYFHGDSSLQNMVSLQSFGTNPASTTANLEIVNTASNDSGSVTGEIYSSVRHPHALPQNPKPFPLFHIPPPQNFPAVYGFPPRMPPPLLPPPGYGFPRAPCLRSRSLEPAFPNPVFPWPPVVQLPGHPSHFYGPVPQGIPALGPGQPQCLRPPTLFNRDDCLPGRRHSDPWDMHDFYGEQRFSRERDGQHRQGFYSESYHERKNRINDKELKTEKYRDRDSTRNRYRERDRSQEKESERKGRDETHRDKDVHRGSRGDRSTDHKTHKESKNSDKNSDKSKHEHSSDREKEKGDRNRDIEKDKERHSKDKVQSDRVKQKR